MKMFVCFILLYCEFKIFVQPNMQVFMYLWFVLARFNTSKLDHHDLYKPVNCSKKTCMLHFR